MNAIRLMGGILVSLMILATPLPARGEDRKGMVVVAPASFHKALRDFVKYRSEQRPVELVALETILKESPGVDDPEKLKRWLFEAWKSRGVRFVLLVGDADVLPVRYMRLDRGTKPALDTAFYPTDLYYADVAKRDGTFDDWNANKGGFQASDLGEVHGETEKHDPIDLDKVDFRPELAVGRWPVESPEQVKLVAEKTIRTDRQVVSGQGEGLRRSVFVWVPGWVDARKQMERWSQSLPKGWSAARIQSGGSKEVVKQLNRGASLVFHVGPGTDDGWADSLSERALPELRNADRLPVVLSAGCSTARFANLPPYEGYQDIHGVQHKGSDRGGVFDGPPPPPLPYAKGFFNHYSRRGYLEMGAKMVRQNRGGAVAYIGPNTGGQPCGISLLEGFVKTLPEQNEPTLGDCWTGAVTRFCDAEQLETWKPNADRYPPSLFFQAMKYMVFGDPALRLPGPSL
jgi:hypothetical protein